MMLDIQTLATDGCDRCTSYHMSSKIVRHPDGVFVTWLDHQYRSILARIDSGSGTVQSALPLALGTDNHCGAALAVTSDRILHAVCGAHSGGFVYRFSGTPDLPESWSLPQGIGQSATYPGLVGMADGSLLLVHRHSNGQHGHWGVDQLGRNPAGAWSWPLMLVHASTPLYFFPTNSLAVAPDGTMHLLIEFYKTYPGNAVPPHSMAVTHYESPDNGRTWFHTDGRSVGLVPIRLEDSSPIRFKGGGNLRPGNLMALPNSEPAFTFWDSLEGTLDLAIRQADHQWRLFPLTPLLKSVSPDLVPSGQGQLAVNRDGQLVIVAPIAPESAWSHPASELHVLVVDPASGRLVRHEAIPKLDPTRPDWLPSIEKGWVGVPDDELFLMYQSGGPGGGCVNTARCAVRLTRLG